MKRGWAACLASMEKMRTAYKILFDLKPKVRDSDINLTVLLKRIMKGL